MIQARHSPTPAQQSPNVKRPLAPYIPEKNPNAPKDPKQALAERQKAAIESRLATGARAATDAAGVDGAAPPPKANERAATPEAAPAGKKSDSPSGASDGAATSEAKPAAEASSSDGTDEEGEPSSTTAEAGGEPSSAGSKPRGLTEKQIRRWAEENPELAAQVAQRVFSINVPEGFIKVNNRGRKIRETIRGERKAFDDHRNARDAAFETERKRVEAIVEKVRPVSDLWTAASRRDAQGQVLKDQHGNPIIDFDMADAAFQANMGGISFDDYARMRARRGVSNPQLAAERARAMRAERELAALKGQGSHNTEAAKAGAAPSQPAAAAPSAAAPAAAPSENPAELWGEELPTDHPLREFAGWERDLHKVMRAQYYDADLDEYSRDPEDVANEILQAKLAKLAPAPQAPAARVKPAAGRPNTPKRRQHAAADPSGIPSAASLTPKGGAAQPVRAGHREISLEEARASVSNEIPQDYKARERRAIERATRALRGEKVEGY